MKYAYTHAVTKPKVHLARRGSSGDRVGDVRESVTESARATAAGYAADHG